jgi:hypothetical protein
MSMCHVCACCNRQTSRKACGSQSWANVRSVAEAVGRVAATTSFPWPTASCPRPTAHNPQSLCAMLEMRHLGSGEDTRCRDGQRGLPPDRHAVIRLRSRELARALQGWKLVVTAVTAAMVAGHEP